MLTVGEKTSIQNNAKLYRITVSQFARQRVLTSVKSSAQIYQVVAETVDEVEVALLQLGSTTKPITASDCGAVLRKTLRQLKEIMRAFADEGKNLKDEKRTDL